MSHYRQSLTASLCFIISLFLAACQPDSSGDKQSAEVSSSDDSVRASSSSINVTGTPKIPASKPIIKKPPVFQSNDAAINLVNDKAELTQQPEEWSVSASSKSLHFDGMLKCQQVPFVGDFQSCRLELYQQGKAVDDAQLAIDGGMKAHGHGLPTKPKLVAVGNQTGQYTIDGLKFSMTGEWTIGFLIEANGVNDQLLFDFTI